MPSKQNILHKICPFEVASCVNSALKIKLIAKNVPFLSCFRENSALKMKPIAEDMPFHGSPYKQYAALKH